jgi:hypothetical protein
MYGRLHHLFHAALKFLVLALFVVVPFVLTLPGQEKVGIPEKNGGKKITKVFFSHISWETVGKRCVCVREREREREGVCVCVIVNTNNPS